MTNATEIPAADLPAVWCRMWSGEAHLAHALIAEEGRQWSGQTPALDGVVGPVAAEGFVAPYSAETGNRYVPRTLVVGHDLVAYTWDVTHPDGTTRTGTDVNVLVDGLVVDNWTFVGPYDATPDPRPAPVAVPFTDAEVRAAVEADATARGVQVHREPVVDVARGTVAYLWTRGDEAGADVVAVTDGAVSWRRSVGAERAFAY